MMEKTFITSFLDELDKIANGEEEGEMKGKKPSEEAVLQFFEDNEDPSDDDFHEWAEENGYNVHKAEEVAYGIISELMHGGRSKGDMPEGVSQADIQKGMEIEKEHTTSPIIARKITADHLKEFKDYYDKKEGLPMLERFLENKG